MQKDEANMTDGTESKVRKLGLVHIIWTFREAFDATKSILPDRSSGSAQESTA